MIPVEAVYVSITYEFYFGADHKIFVMKRRALGQIGLNRWAIHTSYDPPWVIMTEG